MTDEIETLPAIQHADPVLALIERMSVDPNSDVEKLERMVALYERRQARDAEAEFNAAFIAMQPCLPIIKKNGAIEIPPNPEAKTPAGRRGSKTPYAKWEDIMAAVMPILHRHGFALTRDSPPGPDGRITGTATLLHVGGHSRTSTFGPLPLDTTGHKNNLQAAGSTDSYAARYAVRDLLNLVFEGEDDDGAAAGTLSEEQIAQIVRLIKESGVPVGRFLKLMGAKINPDSLEESVATIEAQRYPEALSTLAEQLAKRRKHDATNP